MTGAIQYDPLSEFSLWNSPFNYRHLDETNSAQTFSLTLDESTEESSTTGVHREFLGIRCEPFRDEWRELIRYKSMLMVFRL